MLPITIKKLKFSGDTNILAPIVVDLYIKGYYEPDSSYVLIESNVNVDVDGTILASPLPSIMIDPAEYHVLKAVNDLCDFEYTQEVRLNPYCRTGYILSDDSSICSITSEVPATPPTNSENAVAVSGPNNFFYGIFGSLIFNPGYNVNGTGTFTQIPYTNPFWVNGLGYPSFPSASNTAGPLNRAGVWSTTVANPQTIGFSVCVTLATDGVYYVGFGCDDFGQIKVDGVTIVSQDRTALKAYIQANGYPYPVGLDPNQVTFNFWYIYPVPLTAGTRVLEIIGNNTSGTISGAADIGCEVYNLTPSAIAASTSYAAMGSGLVFSSKDFVGMPIQLGSGGVGFSCSPGYSLKFCDSPPSCVRILTTPVLY